MALNSILVGTVLCEDWTVYRSITVAQGYTNGVHLEKVLQWLWELFKWRPSWSAKRRNGLLLVEKSDCARFISRTDSLACFIRAVVMKILMKTYRWCCTCDRNKTKNSDKAGQQREMHDRRIIDGNSGIERWGFKCGLSGELNQQLRDPETHLHIYILRRSCFRPLPIILASVGRSSFLFLFENHYIRVTGHHFPETHISLFFQRETKIERLWARAPWERPEDRMRFELRPCSVTLRRDHVRRFYPPKSARSEKTAISPAYSQISCSVKPKCD